MRISSGDQYDSEALEGKKNALDSELWHACAGPLVSLPSAGSRVVYFPQGHSEQVAATTNKEVDARIPNYPSLPPQLICQLHDVTMHADVETDEVYAQMTLQPLTPQEQKEAYLPGDLCVPSKQPTNYFCKILTASDTSTHGGFSVPRRAAEKVFPPLDFTQQPPAQELIAKDLHGNEWKFRHIFRGQPKRHLLTTGWSVFVSAKRLVAGDSVLFTWNEKNQLLVGIRRANRPQTELPSSVLSSDSMHIGLLAAAAHAASTNSRFTVFYNPRTSPSEFVVPLAKYVKAVYHTRVSIGMRFRMLFETEESSVRRYMGTITGISDLDPERWPSSHWRSVKVGWDESTAGDKQPRVSLWEIEPLTTFPVYPSPFQLGLKRPWPTGTPYFPGQIADLGIQSLNFQGVGGVAPWMHTRVDASVVGLQSDMYQAMAAADIRGLDPKASSTSILQFLQHQSLTSKNATLVQNQMLPQCQSPQTFLLGVQQNQNEQLQHQQLLYSRQKLALQQPQQMPNTISTPQSGLAPQSHPPLLQAISSQCQQQTLCDSNENFMMNTVASPLHGLFSSFPQDESSLLLGLPRATLSMTSSGYPSKRAAVGYGVMSQGADLVQAQTNAYQNTSSLPPFPGKECSDETDLQNNLFVGITEPSTILLRNRMANAGALGGRNDSMNLPFPSSNYQGTTGAEFSLNPSETTSSCIDDAGLLQSSENVDQVSPSTTTFVKVYKSGSFGRSLDITKFSSYNELRSELARMFNLDGKLEDPIRSGWQLVFVDRENDVLLLGDDPWPEFVNSVWCIKILSPQEVQQMGKYGAELLSSVPVQRLSNCDDYARRQDSRNLGTSVTSVGSLDH